MRLAAVSVLASLVVAPGLSAQDVFGSVTVEQRPGLRGAESFQVAKGDVLHVPPECGTSSCSTKERR